MGVGQHGRARREQVRRRAAGMFAAGMSAPQVAVKLEIPTKSAYACGRAAGGEQALAFHGPPGRRTPSQFFFT